MTIRPKILTAGSLGFCALLGACDPLASDPGTEDGFSLQASPEKLYVGSRYSLTLDLAPFKNLGDYSLTTRLSEVTLDSVFMYAGEVGWSDISWTMRGQRDSLIVKVEHKAGKDSLVRVLVPTFATGFAPIESPAVREYEYFASSGTFPDNTYTKTRIVLTPLGSTPGGFRFEVKSTSVPDSAGFRTVYSADTALVRRNGNRVELWNGATWSAAGWNFPYFIQDTITTLNENAGESNGVYGIIGASEYPEGRGTYQPGVGLIRFRQTTHISMRGSSYWGLNLL